MCTSHNTIRALKTSKGVVLMMEEEMRKEVDYFQRLLGTGDNHLHSEGGTIGQLMELKLNEA